jgi:hypothetical protein
LQIDEGVKQLYAQEEAAKLKEARGKDQSNVGPVQKNKKKVVGRKIGEASKPENSEGNPLDEAAALGKENATELDETSKYTSAPPSFQLSSNTLGLYDKPELLPMGRLQ